MFALGKFMSVVTGGSFGFLVGEEASAFVIERILTDKKCLTTLPSCLRMAGSMGLVAGLVDMLSGSLFGEDTNTGIKMGLALAAILNAPSLMGRNIEKVNLKSSTLLYMAICNVAAIFLAKNPGISVAVVSLAALLLRRAAILGMDRRTA